MYPRDVLSILPDKSLEFSRLDPYPGVYVQGIGEYVEAGQPRTVAIAIGPEFGTVGPELIREAAKEAVRMADHGTEGWIEFDSMINVRASQGNRSRSIEDRTLRQRIVAIVETLVTP